MFSIDRVYCVTAETHADEVPSICHEFLAFFQHYTIGHKLHMMRCRQPPYGPGNSTTAKLTYQRVDPDEGQNKISPLDKSRGFGGEQWKIRLNKERAPLASRVLQSRARSLPSRDYSQSIEMGATTSS